VITDDHKARSSKRKKSSGPPAKRKRQPKSARRSPMLVKTPKIKKLAPSEGPISGGIDITILGSAFIPRLGFVVFGDKEAPITQFWGDHALSCLLPPSSSPGPVIVQLRMASGDIQKNKNVIYFTYTDGKKY